ncbi:MAG TPA: FemAB family XrtA/PEP-CTERM system-associated protein [Allosphingosinicella sp.]|jgi:FemAB-related protein (PEP-CTERM system-associated)
MNALTPIRTIRAATAADHTAIRAFVLSRPEAEPFHLPEWSLAVQRGCRQRAHLLVAEDERSAITGLLPLTEMRSPLFGSALVSTGFGVGGGILGGSADALADRAWRLSQELGCQSAELRGGVLPTGWERREGTYAGFARDIPEGDEAILKAIPRKQRAEVRRSLGFDLDITAGRDTAAHYRVYSESVRNLGTPVFPRALFEAVLDSLDSDVLTVSHAGRPLASVLSLYFNGTVYPYWGGGTADARTWRANDRMYFELMRHARTRGCTRFDFGRSKFGTGAFAFKKNWGFEPAPLTYAVKGEARETNPLSPKYRLKIALWKKLPLPVANLLGPHLARDLG